MILSLTKRLQRARERKERGGALLELAISIPIFVVVIALIFDAGLGFSAARDSSSAARSAARVAALAGDQRLADYRAIDAVRAEYANSEDEIVWVAVYRSVPGGDGTVPSGCQPGQAGVPGLCNVYDGNDVETLTQADFDDDDCVGELDQNWCPTGRAANDGEYLGVGVWANHNPTIGLVIRRNNGEGPDSPLGGEGGVDLEDRAVFALYFPTAVEA